MMNKRGMGWGAIVTILLGIVVIIGVSVGIVKNIKTIGEQLIGIELEKKDEAILEEQFRPSFCEPVQKIVSGITDKTEYYKFSKQEETTHERVANALINCYDHYWKISDNWKKPQDKKLCAVIDLKEYFEKKDAFSISMFTIQIKEFLEKNKLKYEPTKSIKNVLEFTPLVEVTGGYTIQRIEDPFLCINLDAKNKISEMTKCQTTKHLKPVCPVEKETINPEMGWRMTKRKCIPIDLIAEDRMPDLMNEKITKYILSPEEGLCKDKQGNELKLCYMEVIINALINCWDEVYPSLKTGETKLCTIFDARKFQTDSIILQINNLIHESLIKPYFQNTPTKYKRELIEKIQNKVGTSLFRISGYEKIESDFRCLKISSRNLETYLHQCITTTPMGGKIELPKEIPLCKFEEKHSRWQLY